LPIRTMCEFFLMPSLGADVSVHATAHNKIKNIPKVFKAAAMFFFPACIIINLRSKLF